MNERFIYVCASTRRIAEGFIVSDMREQVSRLRYIDDPEKLRGVSYALLYIHPTAPTMRNYGLILEMAKQRGCILARIDDFYARVRRGEGSS